MALTIYNDAVLEFTAATGELKRYVQFVRLANQLRPRLGNLVDLGPLPPEAKQLLTSYMGHKDYNVESGFNGLIVTIAAAFERLVRRLLRDGVIWINKTVDQYDKLSVPLRQQNLTRSGHALIAINDPPAEVSLDYELLCHNLGTCRAGAGALVLNADAFAIYLRHLTPDNLDEALKRIGVVLDWDHFGRVDKIKTITGKTGNRDAANATKTRLSEFIRKRNRVAHFGAGGTSTTAAEVDAALAFFDAFAPALAEAVEAVLKRNHK